MYVYYYSFCLITSKKKCYGIATLVLQNYFWGEIALGERNLT